MTWSIENTLKHALVFAKHLNKCDSRYVALAVLIELGVPTECDGFQYLLQAIVLFYESPTKAMVKGIYSDVSKLYLPAVGVTQIEQTIRNAIRSAWINRDEEIWSCYFQVDHNGMVLKPSNAEFISRIGYFLELWKGCCKEVSYAS